MAGIHFGALVEPLAIQLKDVIQYLPNIEHFQKDADAIVRLNLRGYISSSAAQTMRKQLVKKIDKEGKEQQWKS